MSYRGVIFDLDGTLLDTLEDLADSMNLVLRKNGFPEHGIDRYKEFIGEGISNLARRALPEEQAGEATLSRYVQWVREEYGRRWAQKTRPYPQIPELLHELKNRKLRLAVLTNKPEPIAQVMIEYFFTDAPFEIITGAVPGRPLKPDPAGALDIAMKMALNPDEFLYLGDTGTDMQTAKAAGMYPVGVLWGFRSAAELVENGAELLLEQPEQLLDFIA